MLIEQPADFVFRHWQRRHVIRRRLGMASQSIRAFDTYVAQLDVPAARWQLHLVAKSRVQYRFVKRNRGTVADGAAALVAQPRSADAIVGQLAVPALPRRALPFRFFPEFVKLLQLLKRGKRARVITPAALMYLQHDLPPQTTHGLESFPARTARLVLQIGSDQEILTG